MDNLRKKDLREVAQRAMGFSDDLTRIIDKNCSLCVKIEGKRLDVYRKGNKILFFLPPREFCILTTIEKIPPEIVEFIEKNLPEKGKDEGRIRVNIDELYKEEKIPQLFKVLEKTLKIEILRIKPLYYDSLLSAFEATYKKIE